VPNGAGHAVHFVGCHFGFQIFGTYRRACRKIDLRIAHDRAHSVVSFTINRNTFSSATQGVFKMVTLRVAVCFLLLSLSPAISCGADAEKYNTDWLTPAIKSDAGAGEICAIELEIAPLELNERAGTIRLFFGQPEYNQFGDADKTLLRSLDFAVTFRKSTKSATSNEFFPQPQVSSVLYETDGDIELIRLRLVLDSEQPGDCQLLVMHQNGQIDRVLPLQSERLQQLAKQYPKSSTSKMELFSDLFIGKEDRFNTIHISGDQNELTFTHDMNSLSLDRLGNVSRSTLMGFHPYKLNLTDLEVPDPAGQDRRVFRCDLEVKGPFKHIHDESDPTSAETRYLILDPREGGWHRLILKKSGQVDRILPMYSSRLKSLLRMKSQITDAAERQVFDRLSEEVPYFPEFSCENGRVVEIGVVSPNGKADVLGHLAQLSHLTSLDIIGDLEDCAQLEGLKYLESLHFSHCMVTEKTLQHVGHLSNLKSLSFYNVRLDCRGMRHLSGLRMLTRLAFLKGEAGDFDEHFDDSCLDVFSDLPNIQNLKLDGLPLAEPGIKLLPVSAQLTEVSFDESLPLTAVLNFSKLHPNVRVRMGFSSWRLADGVLRLPRSVTDGDLETLKDLKDLRQLELESTELITDRGLAHLTSLTLKELTLVGNENVTDAGVASIANIETLESLDLHNCARLTNSAIDALKRLPNLRKIKIFGTKIDRYEFKTAIPNCEVIDEPGLF
jgi:hypothetical protein